MLRVVVLSFCCVAMSGCVSEVMGTAEPEPLGGWTRVEGPVDYDDGTLLRGRLTINAQGDMRLATLTDTWKSQALIISRERRAEAFATAMVARTGCTPKGSVQANGQGDLRILMTCG